MSTSAQGIVGQAAKFRGHVRALMWRLQIFDHTGKPLANAKYELHLDDEVYEGMTDAGGWTEKYNTAGVREGFLHIEGCNYEIIFEGFETNEIKLTQSMLNALGFNAGPCDGIKGRRTTQAIRSFQWERGLTVTGELDDETKRKLKEELGIK